MKHLFTLFYFCLLFSFSHAQSVVYVTQNGSGNQSGGSWSDALPGTQLQPRLASAAAGTQFWITSGTYKPTTGTDRSISFSVPSGVQVYGGFAGNEATLANRTLTSPSSTTLSGEIGDQTQIGDNTYHVVRLTNVSASTRLDGLTITGGNATASSSPDNAGGGIHNSGSGENSISNPLIINCFITQNAANNGGGIISISAERAVCSLSLENCVFESNTATFRGGGIEIDGTNAANNPNFINCVFKKNTAQFGGAVNLGGGYSGRFGGDNSLLLNCLFDNNQATYSGGAVSVSTFSSLSKPKFTNCLFINNNAQNNGGAIHMSSIYYSTLETTVTNCVVANNRTSASTEGLSFETRISGQLTVVLKNDIIRGNSIRSANDSETRLPTYNVTYSNIQGGFAGTGNIDADPLFVDAANGDYRLKAGSPAINAGDPGSTTATVSDKDLAGNPRIAQDRIDMGAYEFQVTSQNNADLSLNLRVNSRTSNLNHPVTYQLTVTNEGPTTATNIVWQNRLPDNLVYVGGSNLSLNNGVLSGQLASLAAGASATFTYQLSPSQPGQYRNAAQITAADQPDLDSQPNSGTGDGQDDTSMDDFRAGGGTAVYASANPNQTPLPNVQSNQPAPDPAKADLSLAMFVSNRTPKVGEVIIVSITISNAGGLPANGVSAQLVLPNGVTFVSGSEVSQFDALGVNASVTRTLQVRVAGQGSLSLRAEISNSDQPDPDSRPNSGPDGENDTATVELRVQPAL